jgi:hypothetical protein
MKLGEQEYLALVSYLRDWVGEERLPHWRTLEKWRSLMKRMRSGEGVGFGEEAFDEGGGGGGRLSVDKRRGAARRTK